MSSQVEHPSHYNQGKIEVIEFLEDQFMDRPHEWNAVKYISRAGKKNPAKLIEDLKKAIWYLERKIELQMGEPRRPNDMNETEVKGQDKPTRVAIPINNKEMLQKLFAKNGMKNAIDPVEELRAAHNMGHSDGYREGYKRGWEEKSLNKKTVYDPKLHLDKSVYGYTTELVLSCLGEGKHESYVFVREPKYLGTAHGEGKNLFCKITPVGAHDA